MKVDDGTDKDFFFLNDSNHRMVERVHMDVLQPNPNDTMPCQRVCFAQHDALSPTDRRTEDDINIIDRIL